MRFSFSLGGVAFPQVFTLTPFYEEKVLECSTLYQAGIVYKKENI